MVVILLISISGLQWNTDIQRWDCAEYRSLEGKLSKTILFEPIQFKIIFLEKKLLQKKVENQSEVKLFQSIGVTHVLNTAEQHVDVRLSL